MARSNNHLAKGALRRAQLVDAAAVLIRESGPHAVTHRAVAKRVGCALSATTYYFTGLEELLNEAGQANISAWAKRAENVAEQIQQAPVPESRDDVIATVLRACLPSTENLENHYYQLLAAADSEPVSKAYAAGRARLDGAVQQVLDRLGIDLSAQLVIAVVDGAAVSALSEGHNVRKVAYELLELLL